MDFVIRPSRGLYDPNADVFIDEERGAVVVCVEIAGAEPDTLRITIGERDVLIRGRRHEAVRFRRGSFVQKEIAYGDFAKRIPLPVAVEYGGASATYNDGMLTVALPVASTAYHRSEHTEIRVIVKRTLV